MQKPKLEPGSTDYRPVLDLRTVKNATVTLHCTSYPVSNPYLLLGLIPAEVAYFTVLDLKDTFFSLRLALQSQPIFAFQWEDPKIGRKTQHTWGHLLQGLKNSPRFFGVALGADLQGYTTVPPKRVLL